VNQVQDIACGLLGRGFYANIIGDDMPAYPSQAKKMLTRCKGGSGNGRKRERTRKWGPKDCVGCGSDLLWMQDKKVICPRCKKEPATIKCAAKQYKEYIERVKKSYAEQAKSRVVDPKDMHPDNQRSLSKPPCRTSHCS
jgi:hypothetical protein